VQVEDIKSLRSKPPRYLGLRSHLPYTQPPIPTPNNHAVIPSTFNQTPMYPNDIFKMRDISYTDPVSTAHAGACTTLKPSDTSLLISSFLCCSKPSANATSFH
jgi:hypothetical protein